MTSPYVIEYSGTYSFAVPPEEVWAAIEQVDRFEAWWSWLGDFRLEGGGLHEGAVLRGTVAPPLPYRMRLQVELCDCVRPCAIDAVVAGDLEGDAHLRLSPTPAGTDVAVAWTIEMMQRPMRVAARIGHPLLRWGHDRVVDMTVRSFRRQLRG